MKGHWKLRLAVNLSKTNNSLKFRKKVCIQCSDPYLKNILKLADGPIQEEIIKVINKPFKLSQ